MIPYFKNLDDMPCNKPVQSLKGVGEKVWKERWILESMWYVDKSGFGGTNGQMFESQLSDRAGHGPESSRPCVGWGVTYHCTCHSVGLEGVGHPFKLVGRRISEHEGGKYRKGEEMARMAKMALCA